MELLPAPALPRRMILIARKPSGDAPCVKSMLPRDLERIMKGHVISGECENPKLHQVRDNDKELLLQDRSQITNTHRIRNIDVRLA